MLCHGQLGIPPDEDHGIFGCTPCKGTVTLYSDLDFCGWTGAIHDVPTCRAGERIQELLAQTN